MTITKEAEGVTERDLKRIINSESTPKAKRRPESRLWAEDYDSYMHAAESCGAHDQCMRVAAVD